MEKRIVVARIVGSDRHGNEVAGKTWGCCLGEETFDYTNIIRAMQMEYPNVISFSLSIVLYDEGEASPWMTPAERPKSPFESMQ